MLAVPSISASHHISGSTLVTRQRTFPPPTFWAQGSTLENSGGWEVLKGPIPAYKDT
jgi:hypothetical protein